MKARHCLEKVRRRIGGPSNRVMHLGRRLMTTLGKSAGYVLAVPPGRSLPWAMVAPMEPRPLSGPDVSAV